MPTDRISRAWEAAPMGRQVESNHRTSFSHSGIIHDPVILTTVRASGVQEDDFLRAGAALLIEDLTLAPFLRVGDNIPPDQEVFLLIRLRRNIIRTTVGIMKGIQYCSPDVGVVDKGQLVAKNLYTFLAYVLSIQTPEALVRCRRVLLEDLFPLIGQGGKREDCIGEQANTCMSRALFDCEQNCIIAANRFDSEANRLTDVFGVCESEKLGVVGDSFVELLQRGAELEWETMPWMFVHFDEDEMRNWTRRESRGIMRR